MVAAGLVAGAFFAARAGAAAGAGLGARGFFTELLSVAVGMGGTVSGGCSELSTPRCAAGTGNIAHLAALRKRKRPLRLQKERRAGFPRGRLPCTDSFSTGRARREFHRAWAIGPKDREAAFGVRQWAQTPEGGVCLLPYAECRERSAV